MHITFENCAQAIILIGSVLCPALRAQVNPKWIRAAFVVALVIQPFYVYSTYNHEQWGMLASTVWYTGWQVQGLRNWRNK